MNETNEWKEFLNKKVKIIYIDGMTSQGGHHYSKKYGTITSITNTHLILKQHNVTEAINLNEVFRIEIENGI